ncbi:MAG: hypothetical protein U9O56_00035 [Campylobacterota bacterium]|nr:hypothetical protein [Campylobacterota bacterium]
MKKITFHINNNAYTIDIGADIDGSLENGLKKFLSTDKNLSTEDLLLAYLRKTEEHSNFEKGLKDIMFTIPTIESLNQ